MNIFRRMLRGFSSVRVKMYDAYYVAVARNTVWDAAGNNTYDLDGKVRLRLVAASLLDGKIGLDTNMSVCSNIVKALRASGCDERHIERLYCILENICHDFCDRRQKTRSFYPIGDGIEDYMIDSEDATFWEGARGEERLDLLKFIAERKQ